MIKLAQLVKMAVGIKRDTYMLVLFTYYTGDVRYYVNHMAAFGVN